MNVFSFFVSVAVHSKNSKDLPSSALSTVGGVSNVFDVLTQQLLQIRF